ncbi:MAG: metallophosphoesterase, partial [Rubrimonas sp.]
MTRTTGAAALGRVSAFGAPAIGGVDADVFAFDAFGRDQALRIIPTSRPGAGPITEWAIAFDVFIPQPAGRFVALVQTGAASGDADLFLRDNGDGTAGIGISNVYQGAVPFDAWARIAATFTVENGQTVLRKYVNGVLAGEQTLGASARWSIDPAQGLALFTDNDGETAAGLVSSVFFTTDVPPADQVAAILAAAPLPDAAGFFPAAPSEGAVEIGFANADVQPRYGAAAVIVDGGGFRTPVVQGDSRFGFASQFGIEGPGGDDAPVLKHPAYDRAEGLVVVPPAAAGAVASYTMVWDVRVGALSSGWYALLQTDPANANDGDFFIRASGGRGIGIGGNYTGSVPVDEWTRIALTVQDLGNGQSQMVKFIDGVEVGRQTVDAARFTLRPEGFRILADEDGEVSPGYIAHFGVRAGALSPAEVAALGGADADGPFEAADPLAAQISFRDYRPTVEFGGLTVELRDETPVPAPAIAAPVRDMLVAEGAEAMIIDLQAVFGPGASGFRVETSNGESVGATVDNGVLTLNFGALGFADVTITATDAFGREVRDEFRARVAGEGAYTIAILPDTQYYSDRAALVQTYQNITRWLADNAEARNLAFVTHVGDVANGASLREFQNALSAQQTLRDAGIPFTLTLGNHDFGPGGSASNRDTANFNAVFGVAYMSQDPTFGGVYDQEPGRYDNNYHLIDAPDGTDWIVLNLEFGPRDDVLRWANDVLDQYADRKAMVLNHSYLNWDGRHDSLGAPLLGEGAGYDYGIGSDPRGAWDGETIWREVLSKHANVVFVAGGHIFGDGAETLTSYNAYGAPVHQFLVNYQDGVAREITGNGDASLPQNGGNGAIRLLIVDPRNDAVYTETYFTEFDAFLTGGRGEEMSRDGLTGPYVGHQETILNAGVGVREALARADAGDDQLVKVEGDAATVTLSAGRTTDPKGDIVSHVWTDAAGRVVAEGPAPTLTLPGGKHDFTLTVTTAGGVVTSDAVRVIVQSDDVWLAETFNDGNADGWAPPAAAAPAIAQVGTDLGFTLPSIDGAAQRPLTISFDSHWRPENDQTGQLLISIDGAAPAELLRLDSDTTRDDGSSLNQRVSIDVSIPLGASSLTLFWKMSDAGNNWYWAIDNVVLNDADGAVIMAENFDGLADRLRPAVDENIPADILGWTHDAPDGWSIDTPASVPQGTTEWQGWSFTTLAFWTAADGQGRADFTRADGVFAVADPDEWDDFNGGSVTGRDFESTLSARVDLGGLGVGAEAVGVARIDALGRQHAMKVTPAAQGQFAEYTLVYDIYVRGGQGTWTSLLQTDLTNASDGELFIRSRGDGTGGVGISS